MAKENTPKNRLKGLKEKLLLLEKEGKEKANLQVEMASLEDEALVALCKEANRLYRQGKAVVSDAFYDHTLLKTLKERLPHHPFLNQLEPEPTLNKQAKLPLPQKMLSTQKAYQLEEVARFIERVEKAGDSLGVKVQDIAYKVTAKLDGFAAFDTLDALITRGNGELGSNISYLYERGLKVFGAQSRVFGAGEVVVKQSYFFENFSDDFVHPRNFIGGALREKKSEDDIYKKVIKAFGKGAILFCPFSKLPLLTVSKKELLARLNPLAQKVSQSLDFSTDGVVIEVVNGDIKEQMGFTHHHHRWQIAYKQNRNIATSQVKAITYQTGRSGKITPVVEIKPVHLSGATISRVSGHNLQWMEGMGVGIGAEVKVIRSGEVIPKIVEVVKRGELKKPHYCLSCHSALVERQNLLFCPNHRHCDEQIKSSLVYFFHQLGNVDGLGPATIELFYQNNITRLTQIYQLNDSKLASLGLKAKTRQNLLSELERSKTDSLHSWRFLSAFGVSHLGEVAAMKLLQHFEINHLFDKNWQDFAEIEGFSQITAKAIVAGLREKKGEIQGLLSQGFNLQHPQITLKQTGLFNKKICITGVLSDKREVFEQKARQAGGVVQSQVSSKTDYLLAGQKAGSKLKKAQSLGVLVIDEEKFENIIKPTL